MADLITRERVRTLLHVAETPGASVDAPAELLAALCRQWLSADDAIPVAVIAGSPFAVGIVALPPHWIGRTVRIVLAEDGNG